MDISLSRKDYRQELLNTGIESQKKRMDKYHDERLTWLQSRGVEYIRLLNELSCSSNSGAILGTLPRWCQPLEKVFVGAFLRLRTNTQHRSISDARICKGCHTTLSQQEFSHHVAGCTKITGVNSSAGHAAAKEMLMSLMQHNYIQVDPNEPTHYTRRQCPGCVWLNNSLHDDVLHKHVAACPKNVSFDDLKATTQRRSDIRFKYHNREFGPRWGVIDISLTSITNPLAAKKRVDDKHKAYGGMIRENDEDFFAIIITDTGKLEGDHDALIEAMISSKCRMTKDNRSEAAATRKGSD